LQKVGHCPCQTSYEGGYWGRPAWEHSFGVGEYRHRKAEGHKLLPTPWPGNAQVILGHGKEPQKTGGKVSQRSPEKRESEGPETDRQRRGFVGSGLQSHRKQRTGGEFNL